MDNTPPKRTTERLMGAAGHSIEGHSQLVALGVLALALSWATSVSDKRPIMSYSRVVNIGAQPLGSFGLSPAKPVDLD
jgi:hypothetical protein